MAIDNLTLALNGRLPLSLYAEAVVNFGALVSALSEEIAKSANIGWAIEDLQGSVEDRHVNSALITSIGEAEDSASIERVVRAYGKVGKALESDQLIPYSPPVVDAARKVVAVLNGAITSIRFETPEEDATIRSGIAAERRTPNLVTYGAVEGIVQTLSRRKGLRFALYDTQYDRAVSCYLNDGQEDVMRNVWGNRAIVEGQVTREAGTGRPLAIRRITAVELVEDHRAGFRRARGAVRPASSIPLPEVLVRRLRDA